MSALVCVSARCAGLGARPARRDGGERQPRLVRDHGEDPNVPLAPRASRRYAPSLRSGARRGAGSDSVRLRRRQPQYIMGLGPPMGQVRVRSIEWGPGTATPSEKPRGDTFSCTEGVVRKDSLQLPSRRRVREMSLRLDPSDGKARQVCIILTPRRTTCNGGPGLTMRVWGICRPHTCPGVLSRFTSRITAFGYPFAGYARRSVKASAPHRGLMQHKL